MKLQKININFSSTLKQLKIRHFELNYLGSGKGAHKEAPLQHLLAL